MNFITIKFEQAKRALTMESANQNNFNELNAVPCSAVPTAAAMKNYFDFDCEKNSVPEK